MRKTFKKAVGWAVGLSMTIAIGAGIAKNNLTEKPVYATTGSYVLTFDSNTRDRKSVV